MTTLPVQALPGPSRPLRPRDLYDEHASGDIVSVTMRAKFVDTKATKAGQPWAVLEGQWRGHGLRCVVFPTRWAAVEQPSPGDAVVVVGKLWVRGGEAAVWVQSLTKISLA